MDDPDYVRAVYKMKKLCFDISEHGGDVNKFVELKTWLKTLDNPFVQRFQPLLISTIWKCNNSGGKEECKETLVDALSVIFHKSRLGEVKIFFNLFGYLLQEIYDPEKDIKPISEEYKLSLMKCLTNLVQSLSWDILFDIYAKENVPKFAIGIHVAIKLAKTERLRDLRVAALDAILALCKQDNVNLCDLELQERIAEIFIPCLPGLVAGLTKISTDDEKAGARVINASIKCLGLLVNVFMREYKSNDDGNDDFRKHDEKLALCFGLHMKLTTIQHHGIHEQLVKTCKLLISNCFKHLPKSVAKLIEIAIALSEDDFEDTSKMAGEIVHEVTHHLLADDNYKARLVSDVLEENFYKKITDLPRIFNGVDERQQVTALNHLIGYLRIFKGSRLRNLLFTQVNLTRLILSLVQIAELEANSVSLLEEYTLQDFDNYYETTPWKIYRFHDKQIRKKLELACRMLAQHDGVCDIVLDYLLELFVSDDERRKEVTLLLNEILSGLEFSAETHNKIKNVINMYLEMNYWNLPVIASKQDEITIKIAQNNIVQLCLQLEGIGKMSLVLGDQFKRMLLSVLYVILEKAGSGHPLLRSAGLHSLHSIIKACNYGSITELINDNSDYFSFHVARRLKTAKHDESVLNVLSVVIKHSSIDVLLTIEDIIDGVLVQSCDKYQKTNANAFLNVFAVFVQALHRWLKLEIHIDEMINKQTKQAEDEAKRAEYYSKLDEDIHIEDDGKSIEEMYLEDLQEHQARIAQQQQQQQQSEQNVEEDEPYKSPTPPKHVKLTVAIINRSLNFLPSKQPERKVLVLQILNDGIEALRDWEDELLPIVHKIWSPLVGRFKEIEAPLIINLSFRLLVTLGRLSKDFIRMRTAKDVLPSLKDVLIKYAQESYLKDRGAAYRYTQAYKMQASILPQLARLIYDLDMNDDGVELICAGIEPYLSCKQPLPLQEAVVDFYKTVSSFDGELAGKLIDKLKSNQIIDRNKNIAFLLLI